MICKWCGAVVSAVDKKCGRCGREIPPMSDCGGFYDLVPNARAAAPAAAPMTAPVAPPAPNPEELARRAAAKKKAEQMALIRLGVFALVALVIVIMLVVMIVKMSSLDKRLDALEQEMADLDRDFSNHLEDTAGVKDPFQDLNNPPDTRPQNPPKPEDDMPSIDDPVFPVPQLERWSFTVEETPDNGQAFASEPVRLELPVADGRVTESGICFELPDNAKVDLILDEGTVSITIAGPWLDHYSEFTDGGFTADVDVSDVTCQELLNEEGIVYTMEVSNQLDQFFQRIVEEGVDCGKVCILAIEQTENDEQIFRFSLEDPENSEIEIPGMAAAG